MDSTPARSSTSPTQNAALSAHSRRQFFQTISGLGLVGVAHPATHSVSPDPASGWQIACYTRPWDAFDYRVALDGVAAAGYRYVGLMTHKGKSWILITVDTKADEVQAIAEEVGKRGLRTISIYGGDFPVKESIVAGIKGLQTLIDHCVICRCPNLLLGGTGDDSLVEDYYRVVKECCDYAAERKVGLSVKPHGGTNATGPQCRRLIRKVNEPNFRLWYDPGNILYYSEGQRDPVEDAATVDGLVVGMSVKDFRPPKEVLVTPGTGKVRFAGVLRRLQEGGFRSGPLVVECLEKRPTAAEITSEAVQARRFLENLTEASSPPSDA